jgi:hypothetical protein
LNSGNPVIATNVALGPALSRVIGIGPLI